MGTMRYPKKSHTVGEQHPQKFAPGAANAKASSKTSAPAKGHVGPSTRFMSRESTRQAFLTANKTTATASYSNKTHNKFASEQVKNYLVGPMSDPPKEA